MLVDSGSTHSFVSMTLAASWQGVRSAANPMKVKIMDRGVLFCDQEVPDYCWTVQEVEFCTTLCLLPLGCYDIMLGMDWLQAHSPMFVHRGENLMSFQHAGRAVTLHGIRPHITECGVVTAAQLEVLELQRYICHLMHLCTVKDRSE